MKAGLKVEALKHQLPLLIAFINKDKFLYIDSRSTRARMLPSTHRQPYQEFQQALEQMLHSAVAIDLEKVILRDKFQDLQQLFKHQIAHLSADDLIDESASRWQSLQTEIYKQMRLLETDVMLLQAARSSATRETRITGISDRIKILIQYCEALLQL